MKSHFEVFLDYLPAIDASLNALALCFLLSGYYWIKQKNKERHKKCMLTAFGISCVFLACYLTRHYFRGSTPFPDLGTVKVIYFFILIPHIILAAAMVPMIFLTLHYARTENWQKHRRIARWTFPIWVYVSFTGVIVYLMLYHLAPYLVSIT